MSKVVFVGNVPYNMGEEQLIDVFKSVGQVIGFRLVFDRDTGKPRGYGFCEFADHETAASAVRNLNNVDVGGRPLRIDLADSDPFLEGKTTVRGELVDSGLPGPSEPRSQWRGGGRGGGGGGGGGGGDRGNDPHSFMANLPPGVQLPKGSSALDHISQVLATMPPSQLMEVLAQMKAFVITHPEQARQLLSSQPQLSHALFQALLLNKIVDSAILQRMLEATSGNAAAPPTAPAQHRAPHPPPVQPSHYMPPPPMSYPPPQQAVSSGAPPHISAPPISAMFPGQQHQPPPMPAGYYRAPPTGPAAGASGPPAMPPPAPPQIPAVPDISEAQRTMLMQVLSLTQDQIRALPETERAAILQLRTQFIGGLNV